MTRRSGCSQTIKAGLAVVVAVLSWAALALAGLPSALASTSGPSIVSHTTPAAPLTWSSQALPVVNGADEPYNQANLTTPSCPTPTWCAETGTYDYFDTNTISLFPAAPPPQPWAATTVNGVTTGVALPIPTSAVSATLTPPSCPVAGYCVAVGNWTANVDPYGSAGGSLVETLQNGSWTLSQPEVLDGNILDAVSCQAVGVCAAVGADAPGSYGSIGATLTGGTWSEDVISGFVFGLTSVACPSTTWCEAVGTTGGTTLTATFDAGSWTSQVDSVTLPTNLACGAVGSCVLAGGDQVDSFTEANGWGHPTTLASGTNLSAVSCVSATSCEAVGYVPDAYIVVPVLENWNGSEWTSDPLADLGGNGGLTSVSCTPDGSCTSVGSIALFGSYVQSGISVTTSAAGIASGPTTTSGAVLTDVTCATATACTAIEQSVAVATSSVATQGYWLAADNGAVLNFGGANDDGMANGPLDQPVVGMAATASGGGYWLVAADGGIFSFGDAGFHGSMGGRPLNKPIVGMAADPATGGYWLVAADGGIFSFDAPFFGSTGSMVLNQPIVGLAATADGQGYWLVAADGGIFSFGDAGFHGSMGGTPLNKPIVGMAADPATGGYWMVAADGGIFSFAAPFFGSTGNLTLAQPIVGMAVTPGGGGYRFVAADGGIFSFGDATFSGAGAPGQTAGTVVATAALPG